MDGVTFATPLLWGGRHDARSVVQLHLK